MNKRFHKWILAVKVFLIGVVACATILSCGKNQTVENPKPVSSDSGIDTSTQSTINPSDTEMSLPAFCNDKELNAWFESIEENPPVHMEYIIYGEAPYAMEFSDQELILKTVKALQTVEIGGLSEENPDYVCDGGGHGYYFTMEDGSEKSFSFVIGCFRWNGGEWHDIVSMNELAEVNKELQTIGFEDSST